MHSRDPNKSAESFQKQFDGILYDAQQQAASLEQRAVADFTGFVFPNANYGLRTFEAECYFTGTVFTQDAVFTRAVFTQDVDFSGAKFTQDVDFSGAKLTQGADFTQTEFAQTADFTRAKFIQATHFTQAKFTQAADFSGARFTQNVDFEGTKFTQYADFEEAEFTQHAVFSLAKFGQEADFFGAKFRRDAYFSRAEFTQDAVFRGTTFTGEADFREAKFLEFAEFRETIFRHDESLQPGPIFSEAQFFQPEKVMFYKTYLGQALFYNCDVSEVRFSSVTWREREGKVKRRKRMLFEEDVDLNHEAARDLKPQPDSSNERHYDLIAETYQQLTKNYDDHRAFSIAGDFHYGEMEMKRLQSRRKGRFWRRVHQHLRMVAWYKYASNYGESFVRPGLWLVGVLLSFTLLFPFAGLYPAETCCQSRTTSQMGPVYSDFAKYHPDPTGICRFALWVGYTWRTTFWDSGMTAISVAGLQKELKYAPSYPWGRALALLELLLTSTLIALFLLALRRQFKR